MTPNPAGGGFPFAGNVMQSLEMMSKAWGASLSQIPGFSSGLGQSIPSMMVPTLDVNELDKRITDLRAVEQWLALNANMLRASIQALEVQRNTIATLQTIGATMMNTPAAMGAAAKSAAGSTSPFNAPPSPSAAPTPAAAPSPSGSDMSGGARRAKKTAPEGTPNTFAEMPLNPTAWWTNLQDQFTRIAAAAAGDPQAAATTAKDAKDTKGTAAKTPAKDETKPAARRPPTRRTS